MALEPPPMQATSLSCGSVHPDASVGRCALCGESMPRGRFDVPHATVWKKKRPTFDHIRPRAKGGGDPPENLQLAHARCNKRKGDCWKPPA
jgi:5-methylcytosine-specific restriction endonuclease McrA